MKDGVKLESLNWIEAERYFASDPVVVIPLGAAAKEHGPHLPLNNDAIIATWLAEQVLRLRPVLVAPLINASFYPAFVEYRDLILDSCSSLASFGLSRFYVLNTGISTLRPLAQVEALLQEGIIFDYLNLDVALQTLPAKLLQQSFGSHADEHETSLMLHIAPAVVDMSRAVDDGAEGSGRLTRERGRGLWSRSGVYGQATLASAEKGRVIAEHLLRHCLEGIDACAGAK